MVDANANVDAGAAGGAAGADAGAAANAGGQDAGSGQGQNRDAGGKFARGGDAGAAGEGGSGADAADWRAPFAGADEKALKRLERYSSPSDFLKAFDHAQKKISEGDHLKPPADDAPDDVKAAWRKSNGIPESHDKYVAPKITGFEFGDGDQPILEAFQKGLFEAGASQKVFDKIVGVYADLVAKASGDVQQVDDKARMNFEDTLGKEWGSDYRTNMALAERKLGALPDDLGDVLRGARDAKGQPLAANPAFYRYWAALARKEGSVPSGLAKGGADPRASAQERIAEIEGVMAKDPGAYWNNPKMQEELRELGEFVEKQRAA